MAATSTRRSEFGWRQVRVAALFVIGALLLIYGAYRVGKVFDVFASRYSLYTLVPSAVGLREGAPVTLAGQQIGQVKRIGFIPLGTANQSNHLWIRLDIADEVREQIRRDSKAFLRTQGLLGDKFVDIQPGTAGTAILQEGDTLAAGESLDLEQFLERGSALLDVANGIVADLHDITGGIAHGDGTVGALLNDEALYNRMVTTTEEMRDVLSRINRSEGTLGRLLGDTTLYVRLTGTVARVDSLGAMILAGEGTLGSLITSDSLYEHLLGTAAGADSAVNRVSGFITRATEGNGTLQRMVDDPELYEQFLKAIVDLQSLIEAIRQNPERFKPDIHVKVF